MPNRILKDSICRSDNLNKCSAEEERLFYRLISQCEDFGRFDARPTIIRSACYPLKLDDEGTPTISFKQIVEWLEGLVRNELIIIYVNNNRPFLQMITWEDHNQRRAKYPKYPGPEEEDSELLSIDNICNQLLSYAINNIHTRSDTRSYSNTNIDLKDLKSLNKKKKIKNTYSEEFELFWNEYPRKIDKGKSLRCWDKMIREKHNPTEMILAAKNYAVYCKKEQKEEKFIKHPSTFLGPDKPFLDFLTLIQPIDATQREREWYERQGRNAESS